MTRMLAVLTAAVLGAACAAAVADNATVSLQQALDRPIDLTIEDASITKAFDQLSAKTGVRFVIDDLTMACLPYGDQSHVMASIKNATLRNDLSHMLSPLALTWAIDGDTVHIRPTDALARMCRRSSLDELKILGKLYTEKDKLQPVEQGGPVIDQVRQITGVKELNFVLQALVEFNGQTLPAASDRQSALTKGNVALPCTAAEWLDAVCSAQPSPWTWYLSGDSIVLLERRKQIERQLQQQVSLRYQNEKLVTVLLDLARKARLTLAMDPGVMNYLPTDVRTNFNLVMADATIAQALEVVSGATGLEFIRTDEGLRAQASEDLKKRETASLPRKPAAFFVKMPMVGPGGTNVEVYLRSDELPDEYVEAVQAQKAKLLEKFQPKTRPATTAPTSSPSEK